MIQMDFALARLNHQVWKMRLRAFLSDREQLDESEAVSHTDCDLGQWLYSQGLKSFGDVPEMHQLESLHADLHRKIREVVELKHHGRLQDAQIVFKEIGPMSAKIVALLTTIEQRVKRTELV